MAEIDPVILELRAQVDRYMRDVERATRRVEDQLGRQQRDVRRLEDQFRSSSGAIGTSLKGLAATLATAFTGRELIGLIDQFTRFQNSLKVAGLEGENLARVQERLFQTGARYGVSVNALADLYGKAEQAGRELGASQSQLLVLTDAVAQSLLVSGVSTEQASGAILGLSQALASGTVRAEEFNQINEGGLRILLEAAAAGDQYGGSVARLRNAVAEGEVSSQAFFRSILANAELVEGRAAKANLTLAGSLQALNDALARYVGEASNTSGATGVLVRGIEALAENLDILIPALATIALALGVRVAGGAAAATAQFIGLRVVALGLAVQLNGTAAAATLLGRSLLAAVGGPVGLAIAALTIGFVLFGNSVRGAEAATGDYKRTLEDSRKATDSAREAAERLASAHGKTRDEALRAAQAERQLTVQKLAGAKASLQQARAELAKARAFSEGQNRATVGAGGLPGTGTFIQGTGTTRVATANSNLAAANERIKNLEGAISALDGAISASAAPAVNTATPGGGSGGASSASGGAGSQRDASAIELRFRDELDSIRIRIQQAESQRALTAEERAEYEGRILEFTEDQALRSLEAELDYTDAQKAIVKERLLALGLAERDNIAFRERVEIEQRNRDLADEKGRIELDNLRLQFDMADTERERRNIALNILDAEERLLLAREQAIIDSETAQQADKDLARLRRDALLSQSGATREATERQFANPLERFAQDTKDQDTRIQEAVVRRVQDINDTITDSFTNALGIKDPFLKELISIFLDKNIFGPLAEALSKQGGGGGGGILSGIGAALGSVFGRSSGGSVNAGQFYRVNEGAGAGRVEGFVPNNSGQIIPLGRMNAMQGGGSGGTGTVRVVIEEAPGFAARVRTEAVGVAIEVTKQSAGQIIDAAANETARRLSRPSL